RYGIRCRRGGLRWRAWPTVGFTERSCWNRDERLREEPSMTNRPRALAFDVFGTVVDWRGSVIRELTEFGEAHGVGRDWAEFADDWRAGYPAAMDRVRTGDLPWLKIDALHRLILDDLLERAGIASIPEADLDELNRAWHRLDP